MRKLFIFGLALMAFACGNQKETTQETDAIKDEIEETTEVVEETVEEVQEEAENYRVVGVVHVSETDCPLIIEARNQTDTIMMYPMNLEEKYKKEGTRIKFTYTKSRGQQPENCDVDMVVALADLTLMR